MEKMTNEEREQLLMVVQNHQDAQRPSAAVPTINGLRITCPNMGASILNNLVEQTRPLTADEQQYYRAELARQMQRQGLG